ncbi:hypothetical protein H5U71_04920, partial [Escherichia coli]|nr:hypothetical protein [Escherichia coli]
ADRNRSHWSTSKTPSYTKSVSWQHHLIFRPLKQRIPADLYIVYETQQVTPAMVKLLAALTQ